jgi:alpha-ribazole phosphatase CobZ
VIVGGLRNLGLLNKISYDESFDTLIVELDKCYNFVTTLPYQPDVANVILFKRVPENFDDSHLKHFYNYVRSKMGYGNSIVFLTAASVDDYICEVDDEGKMAVIATMGLEPPVCPGYEGSHEPLRGTINVAIIVDYGLSSNALVDLLRVTAEAKSLAASELLLRCPLRSSGTVTDAIAVGGKPPHGDNIIVAGMATRIGSWVSGKVYKRLVEKGLKRLGQEGLLYNAIGLTVNEIVELMAKMYEHDNISGVTVDCFKNKARELIETILKDPNVWSILIAARELDLHSAAGSIPDLNVENYATDDNIIADKLLALILSLYIANFKGLLSMQRIKRIEKKDLLPIRLPRFEDHIVSALVSSAFSAIYDELSKNRKSFS